VLLASGRAGNVVGGGDWAVDRLIPDIVKAASNGQSVSIRYPKATRPWQHVLEPLSGYLTLGWRLLEGKKEYAEGWNFGPDGHSNLPVEEVVRVAKTHWDTINAEYGQNPSAHEANLLMLDCSKAGKLMKWKPVWDITETMEKTIGWYKSYYLNNQIETASNINDYVAKAAKMKMVWAA
jgi:CDP-glucose 4,6-dehydratase